MQYRCSSLPPKSCTVVLVIGLNSSTNKTMVLPTINLLFNNVIDNNDHIKKQLPLMVNHLKLSFKFQVETRVI